MKFYSLFLLLQPILTSANLNTRQKIACDICSQSITNCESYSPSKNMFNSTRPDASKLGNLYVCDASEDELWSTSGKFKVGDKEHPPLENRSGCPCNPDNESDDCRRQTYQIGKLEFERERICSVLVLKRMPRNGRGCTAWVEEVVPNSQGGEVDDCETRFHYP